MIATKNDIVEYNAILNMTSFTNSITSDTSSETSVTNMGNPFASLPKSPLTAGHTYYVRATARYSSSNFSISALEIKLDDSHFVRSTGTLIGGRNTLCSGIFSSFSGTVSSNLNLGWFSTDSSSSSHDVTTIYKEVMVWDITPIYEEIPQFESLSLDEQKEALDTIPYFSGSSYLSGYHPEFLEYLPDFSITPDSISADEVVETSGVSNLGLTGTYANLRNVSEEAVASVLPNSAQFYSYLAERYARGTEAGVPVTEGEGFEDNSKYYKDLAKEYKDELNEILQYFAIDDEGYLCQV